MEQLAFVVPAGMSEDECRSRLGALPGVTSVAITAASPTGKRGASGFLLVAPTADVQALRDVLSSEPFSVKSKPASAVEPAAAAATETVEPAAGEAAPGPAPVAGGRGGGVAVRRAASGRAGGISVSPFFQEPTAEQQQRGQRGGRGDRSHRQSRPRRDQLPATDGAELTTGGSAGPAEGGAGQQQHRRGDKRRGPRRTDGAGQHHQHSQRSYAPVFAHLISVCNVPHAVTTAELHGIFSHFGAVYQIQRVDHLAMVYYSDPESVQAAMVTMNGQPIGGSIVTVSAGGRVRLPGGFNPAEYPGMLSQ